MSKNSELYLGLVYDSMRMLGYKDKDFYIDIKPKGGYSGLIQGPAFTTKGRLVSKNEDYSALDNIRLEIYKKEFFSNSPIVLLEANDTYCAHSGDITSMIYKELGAVGFITDGNVRDIERISDIGFPTFCRGLNPIDALDYWALTQYNTTIWLNCVEINPNDIIYSSCDGVIRVKKEDYLLFKENLDTLLEKENNARKLISQIKDHQDFSSTLKSFVSEAGRW